MVYSTGQRCATTAKSSRGGAGSLSVRHAVRLQHELKAPPESEPPLMPWRYGPTSSVGRQRMSVKQAAQTKATKARTSQPRMSQTKAKVSPPGRKAATLKGMKTSPTNAMSATLMSMGMGDGAALHHGETSACVGVLAYGRAGARACVGVHTCVGVRGHACACAGKLPCACACACLAVGIDGCEW